MCDPEPDRASDHLDSDAAPRVSIVIPVSSEGGAIVDVVQRIWQVVDTPAEILCVYDDERDSTVPHVQELNLQHNAVRGILNTDGPGPAWAIRTGFAAARADCVVVTAADCSDDLRCVDYMVRLVESGHVLVAASRYMPGGAQIGGPVLKGLLSRTAGLTLHSWARVGIHDATNSYKAYRRSWVESVGLESTGGFEIGIELTAKARRGRQPVTELPTTWIDRDVGFSKFKLARWLPRYVRWYLLAFGIGGLVRPPERARTRERDSAP